MDTETVMDKPRTKRGRPGGLTPDKYDHALLLSKVNNRRRMNVTAICAELHISRQHFYDILNGRVNPRREKIAAISEHLGFRADDILRPD